MKDQRSKRNVAIALGLVLVALVLYISAIYAISHQLI